MAKQQGIIDTLTYDVFISHQSDCIEWTTILAQNLNNKGFNVFFDVWERRPGKNIRTIRFDGLRQSANAILIVTSEAFESGWVREEYENMLLEKKYNRGLNIILAVFGQEIPYSSFLRDVSWIDFRDATQYRQSFARLVRAIKGKVSGSDINLEGEMIIPPTVSKRPSQPDKVEISHMEDLFELFFTSQAVLLFAQADSWHGGIKKSLLDRVKARYGNENVFHLVPPFGQELDMKDYFSLLGKQCDFTKNITGSVSFRAALEDRLGQDRPLFLIVSGFENSYETGREELAGVLRSLNERFPRNLKILIYGGEKLADIAYSGSLSYLNQAEIREWPEMTVSDVRYFIKYEYNAGAQETDIDAETAQKLLDMSGGHPKVLETCYRLYLQNPGFTFDHLTSALLQAPFVWQLFTPFNEDDDQKRRLCQLQGKQDVGPAQPYLYDSLLKRLYWRNLIKRVPSNRRLYWRCEALRMVGRQILGCGDSRES